MPWSRSCRPWAVALRVLGRARRLQCGAGARRTGEPIVARNFDYLPLVQPFYLVRESRSQGKLRAFEFTTAPLAGAVDGMNEEGLCITYNYGFTTDEPSAPAAPISMAISEALGRCGTVAEAADWITSRPRWGGGLLMLCDASGDMASLELSSTRSYLRRPASDEDVLFHTNAFSSAPCAKSRCRGTRFTRIMLPLPCVGGGSISHRSYETDGSNNFWPRLTFSTAVGWGPSWLITAQMAPQVMTRPAFTVRTGIQQPVYSFFQKSGGCALPTTLLAARISKMWFCSRIAQGLTQASISLADAPAANHRIHRSDGGQPIFKPGSTGCLNRCRAAAGSSVCRTAGQARQVGLCLTTRIALTTSGSTSDAGKESADARAWHLHAGSSCGA